MTPKLDAALLVFLRLNDHYTIPRAGSNPPFAEGAEFTEWKTDALANQATAAGPVPAIFNKLLFHLKILYFIDLFRITQFSDNKPV